MTPNVKKVPYRTLVLIAGPKLATRAANLLQKDKVPVQYMLHAVGTASSEMMDILGLGSPEKNILVSILPKPTADTVLKKLKKALRLGTVDSGIAYTLPLTGASNLVFKVLEQMSQDNTPEERKDGSTMADSQYSMITAVVNQGYSEEVMDAARAAGAGGGTVVHSRRIGDAEALHFWGMSIQEEKELVFIVASNDSKLAIMQAIGEKCGAHSEAKGIVVSLPIDTVMGLD